MNTRYLCAYLKKIVCKFEPYTRLLSYPYFNIQQLTKYEGVGRGGGGGELGGGVKNSNTLLQVFTKSSVSLMSVTYNLGKVYSPLKYLDPLNLL